MTGRREEEGASRDGADGAAGRASGDSVNESAVGSKFEELKVK